MRNEPRVLCRQWARLTSGARNMYLYTDHGLVSISPDGSAIDDSSAGSSVNESFNGRLVADLNSSKRFPAAQRSPSEDDDSPCPEMNGPTTRGPKPTPSQRDSVPRWFADAIFVLEGHFSVASDRELLVETVLALWALMLITKTNERLKRFVIMERRRIFPCELFDDLVEQLELLVVASQSVIDQVSDHSIVPSDLGDTIELVDFKQDPSSLRIRPENRAEPGHERGRIARALAAGTARAWQWACLFNVTKMHYQKALAAHVRANAAKLLAPVERFERLCWLRNSQSDSVMLQGLPRTVPQSNGQEGRQST
jgi:hypothetical protein